MGIKTATKGPRALPPSEPAANSTTFISAAAVSMLITSTYIRVSFKKAVIHILANFSVLGRTQAAKAIGENIVSNIMPNHLNIK
jgi:hypothetical protein